MNKKSVLITATMVYIFSLVIMGEVLGAPIRLVVRPTDDTYISSEEPSINFGSETNVKVGRAGVEYRTYLKFDLSKVPDGKDILLARVGLNCHLTIDNFPTVGAHYLEDDEWAEGTLTWSNAPTDFNSTATDEVDVVIGYNYWVVTGDVIEAYSSDDVYSVVLKLADSLNVKWTEYYSKEMEFTYVRPLLEIIYEGEKYGGGSGTSEDPYLIYTAEQMRQIGDSSEDWNKHFKLMSDISLSDYTGVEFPVISTKWTEPFTGVFDGNGHVISNFTYTVDGYVNYLGLFGCLGAGSEVRNLGLMYPHVSLFSGSGIGALTGLIDEGVVRNCWAREVNVSGKYRAGGLVGQLAGGQLIDSYAEGGEISVEIQEAGGLVGENKGQIIRCYSTCRVGGDGSYLGGLIGYSSGATVTASFWDKEASEMLYSYGGTGLPTVLMQTESTFTDAGWDFVGETVNGTEDIWKMNCEGMSYPKLSWWEPALGDFICPDGVDMVDFAVLGDAWMSEAGDSNWDAGCDISEPEDEVIDGLDLAVFVGNWLEGVD